MKRMKAGIIGCGNISAVYLENLQNSPLIEVVAVADLLEERAKARANEFNTENAYKVDELLRQPEIELVFNLTVPGSHALTDMRYWRQASMCTVKSLWRFPWRMANEFWI